MEELAARSDPWIDLWTMLAAPMLEAVRLESGKLDPVPALAETSAPVNSGKSAIYGKTFGHPVETLSAAPIIPPIASRSGRSLPPTLTQARAGKLPAIFTNRAAESSIRAVIPQTGVILSAGGLPYVLRRVLTSCPSWLVSCTSRTGSLCVFRPPVYHGAVLESEFGNELERWNRAC